MTAQPQRYVYHRPGLLAFLAGGTTEQTRGRFGSLPPLAEGEQPPERVSRPVPNRAQRRAREKRRKAERRQGP